MSNDTISNRVIARDVAMPPFRVMRGYEGWAYVVQVEVPDDIRGRYVGADDDIVWEETGRKWHTLWSCSTEELMERWLSVWLNRPVKLMTDELAALAPEAK